MRSNFKTYLKFVLSILLIATVFSPLAINSEQLSEEQIKQQVKEGKISSFTYEMFGAKGDGKTNDFEAIEKAHNCANDLYLEGYPVTVQATAGKTYYISDNFGRPFVVITDVNFKNANFIVDDSNPIFPGKNSNTYTTTELYRISTPMYYATKKSFFNSEQINLKISINESTTNLKQVIDYINSKLEDKVKPFFEASQIWAVRIEDSSIRRFMRDVKTTSNGGADGETQREVILLNSKTGDVLSPIDWPYSTITKIIAYPVPDNPITIENGTFTTKQNPHISIFKGKTNWETANYNHRNIKVLYTGNVNIKNITHFLEDQTVKDAYNGFINLEYATYVGLDNIKLTPHSYFRNQPYEHDTSKKFVGSLGTYDLAIAESVNIDINKLSYACNIKKAGGSGLDYNACYKKTIINPNVWGVMASNKSKNVFIKNSRMNRIDAHKGVTNLLVAGDNTVEDCVIGDKGLTLIGKGRVSIKNCKIDRSKNVVRLRPDYGSSFDGFIFIDNIEWYLPKEESVSLIFSNNTKFNHGYTSVFPQFYVNNVKINKSDFTKKDIELIQLNENSYASDKDHTTKYKFRGNSNFVKITVPNSFNLNLLNSGFVQVPENLKLENYASEQQVSFAYTQDGGSTVKNNLPGTSTQFKYVSNNNAKVNYEKQASNNDRFFDNLYKNGKMPVSVANRVALSKVSIKQKNIKLNEEFSPNRTIYSVNLPHNVSSLTLNYEGNEESIHNSYTKEIKNISYGENTYTFSVVGYKTRKDYTLTISRENPPVKVAAPKCNTLVYNGEAQTLVNPGNEYTLAGNTKTDAGQYKVVATLKTGFVWEDGTTAAKALSCQIGKATPVLNASVPEINGVEDEKGQLTVSASVKGKFALSSSDSTKLSISKTSASNASSITTSLVFKEKGSGVINVEFVGNNNYNNVTLTIPFDIQEKKVLNTLNIYAKTSPDIEYDGLPHTVEGFETSTFTIEGKQYKVTNISATTGEMIDVGVYVNKIFGVPVILNEQNEDVTADFVVNLFDSEVEIIKRELEIIQDDLTSTYSGEQIFNDSKITALNLSANHEFTADFVGANGLEAGLYDNSQFNGFTVTFEGRDVSNNYNISSVKLGKLKIEQLEEEKYEIELVANSYSGIYDGKYHIVDGFSSLSFEIDGKTYIIDGITSYYSGKNVSDSVEEIEITGTPIVYDEQGNDVTDSFTFTYKKGSFTINKAPLFLQSGSVQKIYDGSSLSNTDVEDKLNSGLIREDGFAENEGADYIFTETISNIGEIDNVFSIKAFSNTDLENYDIETQYGKLILIESTSEEEFEDEDVEDPSGGQSDDSQGENEDDDGQTPGNNNNGNDEEDDPPVNPQPDLENPDSNDDDNNSESSGNNPEPSGNNSGQNVGGNPSANTPSNNNDNGSPSSSKPNNSDKPSNSNNSNNQGTSQNSTNTNAQNKNSVVSTGYDINYLYVVFCISSLLLSLGLMLNKKILLNNKKGE